MMSMSSITKRSRLMIVLLGSMVLCFLLANAIWAADNNSEGGMAVEDYMDNLTVMDTASAGLAVDTVTSAATFEGDTSTLKRTSGTPYAIYKRKDIKSFIMVTYFDPSRTDPDFKVSVSSDGSTFTTITPSVYPEGAAGSSWNRVEYSAEQLSNADYLKIEWGSSSSTAHISKLRIAYTGGLSFSDTGFENTTTSQLTTPSVWQAKYAKLQSTDSVNFAVTVESAGGVPGKSLKVAENNAATTSGAVLIGQRVTLPTFFNSPKDILAEIDYKSYSAATSQSGTVKLVVMTESDWNALSGTNGSAALYDSGKELYAQILHNGSVDTDDVTEWTKASTEGHDLTASLSGYTNQTLVFALKLEALSPTLADGFELDNVELNMGELSNSRPHFVNIKELRDKYFGYRWAQSEITDLKAQADPWLSRTIELIPGSEAVTSTNRFLCPGTDSAVLVYQYKSYADILATGETYDTYYKVAEFTCRGANLSDPGDDTIVSMSNGMSATDMQAITTGYYAFWMRDIAWAAYNLSTVYTATGETQYAEKAAEIIKEFADKYPDYALHDVVSPIRPLAAKVYYTSFAEASDFVVPLVFAVDNVYDSGYFSVSEKKAIRDDMLYPAVEVQKRVAEVYNHQVVHDAAISLIGYLYDDAFIIGEGNTGFDATAETQRAMGLFNELLDFGVGEDGVWFEGTLGYHGLVMKFYDYVAEAAKRNGSNKNENLYAGNAKLEAMHDAVLKLLYPDLTIQANNDGGYNPSILSGIYLWMLETADREYNGVNDKYRRFLNEAYKRVPRDTTDIRSLLYGYAEIPKTTDPLISIDNNLSGLGTAITRDYSDANNKLMTTLDYGAVSGTHDHYDKLNVTIFGNGRLWLDDLGRIGYGSVPADEYYTYAIAHNTVSVRNSNQAALGGRFGGMGHTKSMHISSASADGMFPNVEEYKRTLLMIKPFVIDIFKLKSNQNVTFDWSAQAVDSTLAVSGLTMNSSSGTLGTASGYQHVVKVSAGNTSAPWNATFTDTKVPSSPYKYKISMLNDAGMDVYSTMSYGKTDQPTNTIPKLVASKTVNGETDFIALHEFINGTSQVAGFTRDGDMIQVTMVDGTEYDLQYNMDAAVEEASFKLLTLNASHAVKGLEISNDNRFMIGNQVYIRSSNVLSNLSISTASTTINIDHDELDTTQKTLTELTFYVGASTVSAVNLDGQAIAFTRNGDYVTVTAPLRSMPGSRNGKVVLNPTDDTYARQQEPSRVMGSYTTVVASNSSSYDQVGYLQFDLSGYTGNDVSDAKLNLYAFNKTVETGGTVTLAVYGIASDAWDESTLTWSNAPQIALSGGDTVLTGTTVYVGSISMNNNNNEWNSLDVTSFIQNYALGDKKASFVIYNPDKTKTDWIFITSKEGGARAPTLELKESQEIAATQAATVIGGSSAGTNYGTSGMLSVQNGSTAANDNISYLKFDLSAYNHDLLGKGILSFYVSGLSNPSSTVALSVYGIANSAWNESTLTWNNAPNHDPSDSAVTGSGTFKIGTLYVDEVGKYYKLDATDYLNSQLAAHVASFMIVDEAGSNVRVDIPSDESVEQHPSVELYKPIEINVTAGDFIRGGSFGNDNYATSNHLVAGNYSTTTYVRKIYLQFDLSNVKTNRVNKALIKLRGSNTISAATVSVAVYGITDDTWTETGLTWNNAPNLNPTTGVLTGLGTTAFFQDSTDVNDTVNYYEFDISEFIYSQLLYDRKASLILTVPDASVTSYIDFNSDETAKPPVFVLQY